VEERENGRGRPTPVAAAWEEQTACVRHTGHLNTQPAHTHKKLPPEKHPPTQRESRWFAAWRPDRGLEAFHLPARLLASIRARHPSALPTVPFGHALVRCEGDGTLIASEACEELFTPAPPHALAALAGAHIFANGSGSHHQLRKLDVRLSALTAATATCGGAYLYANQRGCDGGRLYYDGSAAVTVNGKLVALGSQFSLSDVEVVTAAVDVGAIESYRASRGSFQAQAGGGVGAPEGVGRAVWAMPEVAAPGFALCGGGGSGGPRPPPPPPSSPPIAPRYHTPVEEIAFGPACWLWDYLRRSGAAGFVLPLSGGADSAAVGAIVAAMARLVCEAVDGGDAGVEADARRVGGYGADEPLGGPAGLASRLLLTVYLSSASASSPESRARAAALASDVGSTHVEVAIDGVVAAALGAMTEGLTAAAAARGGSSGGGDASASQPPPPPSIPPPRCRADGGSPTEALALQNLQARSRMVLTFLLAQLGPWALAQAAGGGGGVRVNGSSANPPSTSTPPPLTGAAANARGFRLVLSASNVDEALWGYLTKYDCSAGDLNPIGGVSKVDLRAFLEWAATPGGLGLPSLAAIVAAPPSAELEPSRPGGPPPQTDEEDMGVTYADLGVLGAARSLGRCGPASMFSRLAGGAWAGRPARAVAATVKRFWAAHGRNRHKATTLTPAYHAEAYSPEDNRFDLRPFLYPGGWTAQFRAIDEAVAEREGEEGGGGGG
jgi:NAD+ synthase (glutamine-hydrolysing)